MRNPWLDLPETAPFVLTCDKQGILDFSNKAKLEHKIHLEILPAPYTGNPEAKILFLNLNPGFYERNEKFLLGDEYFFKASRANLTHTWQEYPFYLLDPRNAASPGYYWWSRKLKPLIDLYDLKTIANEVCAIEYFPYHSVKFGYNILDGLFWSPSLTHLRTRKESLGRAEIPCKLYVKPLVYPLWHTPLSGSLAQLREKQTEVEHR